MRPQGKIKYLVFFEGEKKKNVSFGETEIKNKKKKEKKNKKKKSEITEHSETSLEIFDLKIELNLKGIGVAIIDEHPKVSKKKKNQSIK